MIKSGHPSVIQSDLQRMNWQHFNDLLQREMASGIVGTTIARLIPAAILGRAVVLEREYNHRPTGVRTNPFAISRAASLGLVERE